MLKIQIKHRFTDEVLFEFEATDEQQESGLALRHALEAATTSGADLGGAYLRGADLRGADLDGADLGGAYLRCADLDGAYLDGADLGGADLGGAYLRCADLRGAYLDGADLGGAYLRGAYLRGAYLRGAYLRGADLGGADLGGAYLRGADLGSDLKLAGKRPALQIGPLGSRADTLLAFVTDQGLRIRAGCFFGTRDEFVAAVAKVHGDNVHAREYASALVMIDAHAAAWPADEAPAELPAPAEAS